MVFPFSYRFLLARDFRWVTEEYVKYVIFSVLHNRKKRNEKKSPLSIAGNLSRIPNLPLRLV